MAQNNTTEQDQALEQELGRLRQEYERLREQRFRTEENLANLQRQLSELEAQARDEYGTSDPEELQKLLEEKRAENARLVADYRRHIQEINEGLAEVEKNGERQ